VLQQLNKCTFPLHHTELSQCSFSCSLPVTVNKKKHQNGKMRYVTTTALTI